MLEHRHRPLVPRAAFLRRQALYASVSFGIIIFSLVIGVVGYHVFEGMAWIDAFLNAAMLMGGMGPIGELHTNAGKLFAGCYALYCGLVLIIAVGILAAPIFHRFLHRFHLQIESDEHQTATHTRK